MSIFTENQEPMFASKEHYEFFKQTCERLNADCYLKALIYTVGISEDTRSRWSSFYDEKERTIKPEVINSGWQTSGSVRITRLAFQLFTDSTPTAIEYDKDDNPQYSFKECQLYSVSDTFCCSYAPFFVEAVKLRYRTILARVRCIGSKKSPPPATVVGFYLFFKIVVFVVVLIGSVRTVTPVTFGLCCGHALFHACFGRCCFGRFLFRA